MCARVQLVKSAVVRDSDRPSSLTSLLLRVSKGGMVISSVDGLATLASDVPTAGAADSCGSWASPILSRWQSPFRTDMRVVRSAKSPARGRGLALVKVVGAAPTPVHRTRPGSATHPGSSRSDQRSSLSRRWSGVQSGLAAHVPLTISTLRQNRRAEPRTSACHRRVCPEAHESNGSLRAVLDTEPPESVRELALYRRGRDLHAMRDLVVREASEHDDPSLRRRPPVHGWSFPACAPVGSLRKRGGWPLASLATTNVLLSPRTARRIERRSNADPTRWASLSEGISRRAYTTPA